MTALRHVSLFLFPTLLGETLLFIFVPIISETSLIAIKAEASMLLICSCIQRSSFHILTVKRFELVKGNDLVSSAVIKIGMRRTGNNEQFLVVACKLFESVLAHVS